MTLKPMSEHLTHTSHPLRSSNPTFDLSSDPIDALTPREREIALFVAKGFSNKEVGQILDISHWTVASHLKATYLKLGLQRRSELTYLLRSLL